MTDLPGKAFVLLALLMLEFGGVASRDQLRTLLWEDAAAGSAAENLRWLLLRLRRWQAHHGTALITADRAVVRLSHDMPSDLAAFSAIESVETSADIDRVMELYRGDLLTDVDGDLGPQLLDLLGRHRAALRRRYVALLRPAAERIGGERGERVLRHLMAVAPDDEGIARSLLLHLAREQGPHAVESEYRALMARLRTDFDSEPSLETASLFAQLAPARAKAVDVAPPPLAAAEEAGIPRIVLLPPTCPFGTDPHTATIADALIEDVSLQLCRMRTFAMFAPYTARQVAGAEPVAAVAPFGVGYVASTRLLPAAGGGLRLSLSMVRTATLGIVFAEQFAFEEARLGISFAGLAHAIASRLATAVEETEVSAYRRTGAASAYVQYLLGMRSLDVHELKSLRRARSHFARALELEHNYVPALTGMARTLSKESLALRRSDRELASRAMSFADRAAKIDPLDPDAWREKALASLYLHDLDGSLAYLDMAQERAAHYADIIAETADVLVHASRPEQAKRKMEQALSLNPLPPDDYYWTLGSAEFFLGAYEASIETLLRMRNTDSVSRLIAASAAMAGDMALAAKYRTRWLEIYPDSRIANFTQFMPHASKADVDHYLAALRLAGFP